MAIVDAFDVHRRQITFDYWDSESGRVQRGRVHGCRQVLREWLEQRFAGCDDVVFAVEGCTGWRFVVEELRRVGIEAHLAEPADTSTARGRKRRWSHLDHRPFAGSAQNCGCCMRLLTIAPASTRSCAPVT